MAFRTLVSALILYSQASSFVTLLMKTLTVTFIPGVRLALVRTAGWTKIDVPGELEVGAVKRGDSVDPIVTE